LVKCLTIFTHHGGTTENHPLPQSSRPHLLTPTLSSSVFSSQETETQIHHSLNHQSSYIDHTTKTSPSPVSLPVLSPSSSTCKKHGKIQNPTHRTQPFNPLYLKKKNTQKIQEQWSHFPTPPFTYSRPVQLIHAPPSSSSYTCVKIKNKKQRPPFTERNPHSNTKHSRLIFPNHTRPIKAESATGESEFEWADQRRLRSWLVARQWGSVPWLPGPGVARARRTKKGRPGGSGGAGYVEGKGCRGWEWRRKPWLHVCVIEKTRGNNSGNLVLGGDAPGVTVGVSVVSRRRWDVQWRPWLLEALWSAVIRKKSCR